MAPTGCPGDPLPQQQPHAGQVGHRVHGRAEPVGDVGVARDLRCRIGIVDLPATEHQSRSAGCPRDRSPLRRPRLRPARSRPPRPGRDNARLHRWVDAAVNGGVGGPHGEVLRFRLGRRHPLPTTGPTRPSTYSVVKHCGVNAAAGCGDAHRGDRGVSGRRSGHHRALLSPDRIGSGRGNQPRTRPTGPPACEMFSTTPDFTPSPPRLPVHTNGLGVVGRRFRQGNVVLPPTRNAALHHCTERLPCCWPRVEHPVIRFNDVSPQ